MPQTSSQKAAHLVTGSNGEDSAVAFLEKNGLCIVARNWRSGRLELDIIARDGDTLVFVEVKSRSASPLSGFGPLDAFDRAKRERVLKAAKQYMTESKSWSLPCRFDLICVIFKPDNSIDLEHHKNVLSFEHQGGASVGCRNTPWQPW